MRAQAGGATTLVSLGMRRGLHASLRPLLHSTRGFPSAGVQTAAAHLQASLARWPVFLHQTGHLAPPGDGRSYHRPREGGHSAERGSGGVSAVDEFNQELESVFGIPMEDQHPAHRGPQTAGYQTSVPSPSGLASAASEGTFLEASSKVVQPPLPLCTPPSSSPAATAEALRAPKRLTHVDSSGRASMVNVSGKDETVRIATASGRVLIGREAFALVAANKLAKGDVLTVAQIAGINGAKQTSSLIPLCHNILLSGVDVRVELDEGEESVRIWAKATSVGPTGVEMEALSAVSVAALTVYDMCKAVSKGMLIQDIRLESKMGGKSGDWRREGGSQDEARQKSTSGRRGEQGKVEFQRDEWSGGATGRVADAEDLKMASSWEPQFGHAR